MRTFSLATVALGLTTLLACEPLEVARDISGNFDVTYSDNLRIYINDELVAEVSQGEDEAIEWNGETFQASSVCAEDGTECPSETFTSVVGVEQPWGAEYRLVNFVNLDPDMGVLGQRMGGTLDNSGALEMLAGLQLGGNDNCAAIGVGTVHGQVSPNNQLITNGIVRYEWAGGCTIDGVEIGAKLTLETDFTADRTGALDLSSVTPDEPIDDEGEQVDPEDPDQEYQAG